MNKTKLLWILLTVCLISNGVLLWKSRGSHPHGRHHHHEPKQVIMKQLNFDPTQCEAYETLIGAHRQAVTQMENKILVARAEWYEHLARNEAYNDSMALSVAHWQCEIERIHYHHFEEIRKLCKPEQLNNFNILIAQLPQLFQPKMNSK